MGKKRLITLGLGGILPAAAIAAVAVAGLWFGGARQTGFSLDGLPEATVQNYRFAASHSQVLARVPCYCGCYGLGHQSLADCYLRRDGGYEEHASGCDVCGREVDEVARLLQEGNETPAVRASIDARFSTYGRGTDTP